MAIDWVAAYAAIDRALLRRSESARADQQRLDKVTQQMLAREAIADRLRAHEVVVEAIYREGVYWR